MNLDRQMEARRELQQRMRLLEDRFGSVLGAVDMTLEGLRRQSTLTWGDVRRRLRRLEEREGPPAA